MNVAGEEMEIAEYVEEEGENTIKMSTEPLAHRRSFIRMRDDMQRNGITTRASLEFSGQNDFAMMGGMGKGSGGPPIHNGRVILGVIDPSNVDPFAAAFSMLPANIELVPCMGPQNIFVTCQQVCSYPVNNAQLQ